MSTKRQIFKDIQFKLLDSFEGRDSLIESIQQHGGTINFDEKSLESGQQLFHIIPDFQGVLFFYNSLSHN
jgi:hypothetical protein